MANALIGAARAEKWQSPDGKIHILGIGGDEITPASIARNAGLKLAVDAAPDVVVDRMLFANWTQSEAEQVTTNYLSWAARKEIRPAGIWAGNDPMALGALRAVVAAGLTPGRNIQLVGLNWSEDALREIKAGRLLMTDGGHFLLGGWSIVSCATTPTAAISRPHRPRRGQDVCDHARQSRCGRRPHQDARLRPDRFRAFQGQSRALRPVRFLHRCAHLVADASGRRC